MFTLEPKRERNPRFSGIPKRAQVLASAITKAALGVCVLTSVAGCDLLEDLGSGDLTLFVTHSPSDDSGVAPAPANTSRYFTTDQGWDIILTEGWIATREAYAIGCNNDQTRFDFYWGPIAEDLIRQGDEETKGVGGTTLQKGTYCAMLVKYEPFVLAEADPEGGLVPEDPLMDGYTVLLRGLATKNGVEVPFDVSSQEAWTLVSPIEGDLKITGDESRPVEVTMDKNYDTMLDGIDFSNYSQADVDAAFDAALMSTTLISVMK